jgi:hypothetical protein
VPDLHSCPPAWHRSVSCHSCNTNSTTHSSNTCCMLVPSSTVETVTMPPMSKRGAIAQVQQGNTIQVRRQLHAVSRACAPLGPACCMAHLGPACSMHAPARLVCHAFWHQLQQHNCRSVGLCEQLAQQPLIHLGLHFIKPAGMANEATTLSMAKPLVALHR